eukprot:CAMPEP_0202396478 /NCGR_PEP_ID=MMETSP1127-20130417/94531_1 /ASSEMBLY_ACC=CAM_ASM_000462 /TAXON_ID=3047 /ORGANISM="Dunaliella tertiolecta, Strain CCMP1320" /LENGTH=281 /DNA_ID=CAMNT_0048999261 /DNA_START=1015 /DNA_END=1857 /DNA_ORIENTATION=+
MLWVNGAVLFKKEGDEALLTGTQFEILAGKGSNKKWKHSVQLLDGSMNVGLWLERQRVLEQQANISPSLPHTPGNCNECSGRPQSSNSQQGSSEDEDREVGRDEDGGLQALQKEIAAKKADREQLLRESNAAEAAKVEEKLKGLLRLEKELTPFKWDKNGPPANLAQLLPLNKSKRSKHLRRRSVLSRPSSSPFPLKQQLFPDSPLPASLPQHLPNNISAATPASHAHTPPLQPSPIVAGPSQQALPRESDELVQERQPQLTAVPISQVQQRHSLPVVVAP